MSIDDNPSGHGHRDIKGTVAEHNRNIAKKRSEAFDEMDNLPEDFMARSSLGFMRTFDGAENEMRVNDQPVSTSEIEGLRRLLEQAEPYDNEDLSTDVL